jgi:hypothetical protein
MRKRKSRFFVDTSYGGRHVMPKNGRYSTLGAALGAATYVALSGGQAVVLEMTNPERIYSASSYIVHARYPLTARCAQDHWAYAATRLKDLTKNLADQPKQENTDV